ncbi:ribonuclease H-like domain-containing protein [Tanacetum coccineum]
MFNKKNSVLFTDTACVVLSLDFKLTDESHVLLKVPRKDNMYNVDLKNVVHFLDGITCLLQMTTPAWNLIFGIGGWGGLFTILNTIDHLGKFDGKVDEGFFVGYSTNSKAFRVFNSRTRIVEENLYVKISEDIPNIARSGPNCLFYIDALTNSINYKLVVTGNQSNGNAGTKACDDAGKTRMETVPGKEYILLPLWSQDPPFSSSSMDSPNAGFKPSGEGEKKDAEDPGNEDSEVTNNVVAENTVYGCADDPNMPELEEIARFSDAKDDILGADMNNLDTYFQANPIPTTEYTKTYHNETN